MSWEKPVSGKLPNTGGLTVHSSPAPGSGSVMAAILGIVGQYKPLPVDVNRVTSWHRSVVVIFKNLILTLKIHELF